MPRPYRFAPHPATDAEAINALNQKEGHTGVRRFEPADEAVARIESAKSAILERLRSWTFHPDETVAMALVHNKAIMGDVGQISKDVVLVMPALYQRAAIQAAQEKMLWTPLLDALGSARNWILDATLARHVWYSYHNNQSLTRVQIDCLTPSGQTKVLSAPELSEFLAPLALWIRTQTDPEEVLPLLRFKTPELRRLVASTTRNLTDKQLGRMLRDADSEMALSLAENPHLTATQRDRLGKHLVASVVRLSLGSRGRPSGKRALARARHAPETVAALQKHGVNFDYRHLKRLARVKSLAPSYTFGVDEPWDMPHFRQNLILAIGSDFPSDILQETILNFTGSNSELARLIEHPAMNETVLVATVKKHTAFTARKAAARAAGRIKSAAVRDELAKSQSPGIAGALVSYEAKPRRHNSLLRKALRNEEGQEEVLKSLADFENYVCLNQLSSQSLAPLYEVPVPEEKSFGSYGLIHKLVPTILRGIQTLALLRQIARQYANTPEVTPIAEDGEQAFNTHYPLLFNRYLEGLFKMESAQYRYPPTPPRPLTELKIIALGKILALHPTLADTLSMAEIKELIQSSDKDVRLAALKALPYAKREAPVAQTTQPAPPPAKKLSR